MLFVFHSVLSILVFLLLSWFWLVGKSNLALLQAFPGKLGKYFSGVFLPEPVHYGVTGFTEQWPGIMIYRLENIGVRHFSILHWRNTHTHTHTHTHMYAHHAHLHIVYISTYLLCKSRFYAPWKNIYST